MTTEPFLILAGYSAAIIAASLLGGWLPALVKMTHTRTQLVMSFVAGLMLGVAVYHLLPHALLELSGIEGTVEQAGHGSGGGFSAVDTAVWWVMLGMVLMLLLLRLFHFHQHDFSDEEDGHHQHHGHADHGQGHSHDTTAHPLSWVGIALGLGLHTLIDGVALGAAIKTGILHSEGMALAGFGVFLAIFLHKPLDALSITSVMQAGGWSARARSLANLGFATLCPLGAVLFFWGVGQSGQEALIVGSALAFSAGVFLCIALGDLLPEVHFHSHDRFKLTFSFLLGIGLAYGLRYFEPALLHSF